MSVQTGGMPFADEAAAVAVLEYQSQWPVDFERLAGELHKALGSHARAIDHSGAGPDGQGLRGHPGARRCDP
ncbi:hypothetical protein [Streptomyces sp. NPDC006510]|uniref:hypothetical protein n=1 Tax=Streptomyces sp. NPDC006510 TaxID=3155600 RepID=UPI0033B1B3BD